MQIHRLFALGCLAAAVSSQSPNITAALSSSPDLSSLANVVSQYPSLLSSLANATNITILAPSNQAFTKLLNNASLADLTGSDAGAVQALLQYHVLNGTYPASTITDTPAFVPTLLQNTTYSNVTGGQGVEAVRQGDSVIFYSGLLSNASVTQAVTTLPIGRLVGY